MLIKARGKDKKKNLGIKTTLVISFISIILITMSALSFIAYIISKQALSTLGQTALNNRVNMGISIIEMLDKEVQESKLTRQEAEEMFRQKMLGTKKEDGKSRTQNDKLELGIKAYMYAINSKGIEVMHPAKEGEDISTMVDPKGTKVAQLIIDEGNTKKNNGIIHFYWKNPADKVMKPKTNAVGYYEPWDWYINVGVYDEDFYKPAYKVLNAIILMTVVNLILGSLLMYFLISKRINPLKEIKDVIEQAASGNLVNRVDVKYNDEIGEMVTSFNSMLDNVGNLVIEIKNSSNQIQEKSQNLSSVSEELAVSSEEVTKTMIKVSDCSTSQSMDIGNVSSLLNEFTGNVETVYSKLQAVKNEADNASSRASIGEKEVNNLVLSTNNIKEVFTTVLNNVDNLNNSMLQISKITNAINAISTSTNLLALNAAIEAARAGEAGKGFAVVADQVRKLAEESKNFTDEINDLVITIQNDTSQVLDTTRNAEGYIEHQSSSVENAISSFKNILVSIDKMVPLMKDSYESMNQIAEAEDKILSKSRAASAAAEENSTASQQVTASSQQLAGSSQEVAATAQNLNGIANSLLDEVNRFNV